MYVVFRHELGSFHLVVHNGPGVELNDLLLGVLKAHSGFGPAHVLTEATGECRRWLVDLFMDGCSDRRPGQERGMEPCDICSSVGSSIALRRRASQFQNEDTCRKEVQIRLTMKRRNAPKRTEYIQAPS